jgi:hypothetical protein
LARVVGESRARPLRDPASGGTPLVGRKSRIAEALAERAAGETDFHLRYFRSPHHQDSAVYPMIVQMERAAGFGDAPGEKPANRGRCAARGSARVAVGQHRPTA